MTKSNVRIFVDDNPAPLIDAEWPAAVDLDTRTLEDGPHRLVVRAADQGGVEGIEEIPFNVRNGPGITVSGIKRGTTRSGTLHLQVDAFSAHDPFDARRAEARSAIPTWVWILITVIFAWVVYYVATMWNVPEKYATTPTFSGAAATQNGSTSTPTTP